MTEQEWLSSTDPVAMLDGLGGVGTPLWHAVASVTPGGVPKHLPPSRRKLRLFAEAIEPMLGGSSYDKVEDWFDELTVFLQPAVVLAVNDPSSQAALLRTIIGNPWRPATIPHESWRDPKTKVVADWKLDERPVVWPSVLTHADGRVPKMAQVIYDERAWNQMGLLADALEDAGCSNEAILRWCRGEERCPRCLGESGWEEDTGGVTPWGEPVSQWVVCDYPCTLVRGWIPRRGPSVRGDWVIDLLTGRE